MIVSYLWKCYGKRNAQWLSHATVHCVDIVGCNEYSRSPCAVTKSLPPGCDLMRFVGACTPFLELVAKMSWSLQTLMAMKMFCCIHALFQSKKIIFLQNALCLFSLACFHLSEPCMHFCQDKYQTKFSGLMVTKEFVELPSTLIYYPDFFLHIYEANCFLILFLFNRLSLSTLPFTSLYWHAFNLLNYFYCCDNFEFKSCPPAYLYLLPVSGACAMSRHSLPLCLSIYGILKYL